ncbi:hypothetical protein MASR2M69_22930 [Bacteroidota bacterium]
MQKENSSNTDYLLSRILSGKADSHEVERFALWIKESRNERYFEEYKEVWHTLNDVHPNKNESDRSLTSLLNYIEHSRRKQRVRKRLLYAVSAAASLILIAGLYALVLLNNSPDEYSKLAFAKLKYNDESIKVELSDGSVINPLGKQTRAALTDQINLTDDKLSENIRELNYLNSEKSKTSKSDTLKFNSVTIPPGERFARCSLRWHGKADAHFFLGIMPQVPIVSDRHPEMLLLRGGPILTFQNQKFHLSYRPTI